MFFRLSEALANLIFSIGNLSLIFGAVFVLLGSILVPWSAGEKDRHSNEKIAEARKVGSIADEKAGLANERAAKLELEAKSAALETERLKAKFFWRELSPSLRFGLINVLSTNPSSINIAVPMNDTEALYFATQVVSAFREANWSVNLYFPGYPGALFKESILKDTDDSTTEEVAKALDVAKIPYKRMHLEKPAMSLGSANDTYATSLLIGSKLPL